MLWLLVKGKREFWASLINRLEKDWGCTTDSNLTILHLWMLNLDLAWKFHNCQTYYSFLSSLLLPFFLCNKVKETQSYTEYRQLGVGQTKANSQSGAAALQKQTKRSLWFSYTFVKAVSMFSHHIKKNCVFAYAHCPPIQNSHDKIWMTFAFCNLILLKCLTK